MNARLPLIVEYSGVCHAPPGAPIPAPADMRFACNHGYSHEKCAHFPLETLVSALRFSILGQNEEMLHFMCIEESGYAPIRWHTLRYVAATDVLEPLVTGKCINAQALAFCRSYLNVDK
ncbi:MAG: hypothetical protein M3Y57_07735 [Acidobacteriota bacterium]|nr:hypothetical protein [Acidobacteriota bacterium]